MGIHPDHEFQYYKLHQKQAQSLAQLQKKDDEGGEKKGKAEVKDPLVEEKIEKVKAIDAKIDAATNVEKSEDEKAKDFETKVADLAKDAEAAEHKTSVKALEKEKDKLEEKAEAKKEA